MRIHLRFEKCFLRVTGPLFLKQAYLILYINSGPVNRKKMFLMFPLSYGKTNESSGKREIVVKTRTEGNSEGTDFK